MYVHHISGASSASIHEKIYAVNAPRITSKTIIIRQVEQFFIALLELILDTDIRDSLLAPAVKVCWRHRMIEDRC